MRNWIKILIDNNIEHPRVWYFDEDKYTMYVREEEIDEEYDIGLIPLVDDIELVNYQVRYTSGGGRFVYVRATYTNFIFFSETKTSEVYCNSIKTFDFSEIIYDYTENNIKLLENL